MNEKPARALAPRARLFFYGTLLDPDIQQRVVGRALPADDLRPATLNGFRRVRVAGKWFPMLVPGLAADTVAGALVLGLTGPELKRVVTYEGDGYGLKRVTVRLGDGTTARAQVFVPLAAGGLKPSAEAWDLLDWQRRVKPRVLRLGLMS